MWSRLKGKFPPILEPSKGPKTVGLAVGYFMVLNYVVGNGFLGIPFTFYHAGMVGSITIFLFIMFMEWNSARWLFEVMSRAQVGLRLICIRYSLCVWLHVRNYTSHKYTVHEHLQYCTPACIHIASTHYIFIAHMQTHTHTHTHSNAHTLEHMHTHSNTHTLERTHVHT